MKIPPPPPEEIISDTEKWRSVVMDRLASYNARLMRIEIVIYLLAAYLLGLRVIPILGQFPPVTFP